MQESILSLPIPPATPPEIFMQFFHVIFSCLKKYLKIGSIVFQDFSDSFYDFIQTASPQHEHNLLTAFVNRFVTT